MPIAKKLGMHLISKELEEQSFKLGSPALYKAIQTRVNHRQKDWKLNLEDLKDRVTELLTKNGINSVVTSRKKTIYSIYRKVKVRKVPFRDIHDLIALRIIVDDKLDCYKTLGCIHSNYTPKEGLFKDYIAIPKQNNYQSLHTIVHLGFQNKQLKDCCAEIQIRTKSMDYIANYGAAAHSSVYKTGANTQNTHDWIQDLIANSEHTIDPVEFREHIKHDLAASGVYVFSPTGEIYELPNSATALDFAFKIHTDIGLKASECKIDGEPQQLSTRLQSGQTVEIFAKDEYTVQHGWLKYIRTIKARAAIVQYLASTNKADAQSTGEKIIIQLLLNSAASIDNKDIFVNNIIKEINKTEYNKQYDLDSFYVSIGHGNMELLHKFQRHSSLVFSKSVTSQTNKSILITTSEQPTIAFAECCYPLPGDTIKTEYSNIYGIRVHRYQCRNYRSNNQQIYVDWAKNIKGYFKCKLTMKSLLELGVFEKIARICSQMQVHIEDLTITNKSKNVGMVTLVVLVNNRIDTAKLIKKLRTIDELIKINRKV